MRKIKVVFKQYLLSKNFYTLKSFCVVLFNLSEFTIYLDLSTNRCNFLCTNKFIIMKSFCVDCDGRQSENLLKWLLLRKDYNRVPWATYYFCFLDISWPLEYGGFSFPSICLPSVVFRLSTPVSIFTRQIIFSRWHCRILNIGNLV